MQRVKPTLCDCESSVVAAWRVVAGEPHGNVGHDRPTSAARQNLPAMRGWSVYQNGFGVQFEKHFSLQRALSHLTISLRVRPTTYAVWN